MTVAFLTISESDSMCHFDLIVCISCFRRVVGSSTVMSGIFYEYHRASSPASLVSGFSRIFVKYCCLFLCISSGRDEVVRAHIAVSHISATYCEHTFSLPCLAELIVLRHLSSLEQAYRVTGYDGMRQLEINISTDGRENHKYPFV